MLDLEAEYESKFDDLKHVLVEKLFQLVNGKTSQGVNNNFGEEVFQKVKSSP